jgi:hypothetical protein
MRARLVSMLLLSGLTSVLKGGSISGLAEYVPGKGPPGAYIHLQDIMGDVKTDRTAADGSFRFTELAEGEYSLTFDALGFVRLHVERIPVNADSDVRLPPVIPQVSSCPDARFGHTNFLRAIDSAAITRITGIITVHGKARNIPPVYGAKVILDCDDRTECGSARSGKNGIFTVDIPSAQKVHVRIEYPGFYTSVIDTLFPQKGWDNNYGEFRLDRCPLGNCNPRFRPKPPISICE